MASEFAGFGWRFRFDDCPSPCCCQCNGTVLGGKDIHAEINRLCGSADPELEARRTDVRRIEHKLARLVDAVIAGGDARALNSRMRELEELKDMLTAKLSSATAPLPRLHPNLAAVCRQKVADLHIALNGEQAREQVRGLIDRVVLMPTDGELRIDLYGEIAVSVR